MAAEAAAIQLVAAEVKLAFVAFGDVVVEVVLELVPVLDGIVVEMRAMAFFRLVVAVDVLVCLRECVVELVGVLLG